MANTPNIRFKGCTDPWEQRKLGDVIDKLTGGASIAPDDYVEEGYRTIPKGAVNDTGVADMSGCKVVTEEFFEKNKSSKTSTGELITSLRDLVPTAPNMGRIVRICGKSEDFLMPQGVYSIIVKEKIDGDFLIAYSNSPEYRKKIMMEKNGSTQVHIRNGEFLDIDIPLPSYSEQEKIGTVINNLDNFITFLQRKCDEMSELKKFMLQKMFPKDGGQFPEIRFSGFTDPWEQYKLEDVTEEFKSGSFIATNDIEENGEYPVYGGNGLRGYASTYNHDGEFALIGRQGAHCGNMNYCVGKAYFTEHAVAVKANNASNTRFLYYLLDKMNLGQYSDQSAQPGLAVGKLIKLENMFPSRQEQEKIGTYFKSLDNLITLHQRKCEELKDIKKFMLQNMFPQKG